MACYLHKRIDEMPPEEPCPRCEAGNALYRAGQAKERRERIATAVLAGLNHDGRRLNEFRANARYALDQADYLISELDK